MASRKAVAISTGLVGTAMVVGGPTAFANPQHNSTTTTSTTVPSDPGTTTTSTSSTTTTSTTTTTLAPVTSTSSPASTSTTTAPGIGARVQVDTGFGKQISVSVDPKVIFADGTDTSTATALLTVPSVICDSGDAPCYFTEGNVTFTSSDPNEKIGPTTPPSNGTNNGGFTTDASAAGYTAVITASTTPEVATITAIDTAVQLALASPAAASTTTLPPNSISASTTLTQIAGPATKIAETVSPGTIVADGKSQSTVKATVTDAHGHLVAGDHVTFASSDAGEKIGPVTDHGDGTYTAVVTASTKAQTDVITATDSTPGTAISAQADLVQVAGPAAHISLVVSPASIPADGKTTSTATATVADAFGNPVAGDHVTISSSDPNEKVGSVTGSAGTYTAAITASTAVETATITATDLSVSPNISAAAPLSQTAVANAASRSLPFTGMPAGAEAASSAALVGMGAGLVALVRRRRRPRFAHSIKR